VSQLADLYRKSALGNQLAVASLKAMAAASGSDSKDDTEPGKAVEKFFNLKAGTNSLLCQKLNLLVQITEILGDKEAKLDAEMQKVVRQFPPLQYKVR